MVRSDAQKRSDKKYHETHKGDVSIRSLRMTKEESQAFSRACEAEGISPHSVLLAAAREVINRHPELGIPEVGEPGRKANEYNVELFNELYNRVKCGELKATQAATELGVNLRKWYRLAKARKEAEEADGE